MSVSAEDDNGKERRFHQRFKVKNEALVFFGKDTGIILDIGRGGMAVQLAVFEQDPPVPPLPPQVDIFLAQSRFYLTHLPVSLVSVVQPLPHSSFSSVRIKRLGMQFGNLSNEQQARIDDFIAHNTVALT